MHAMVNIRCRCLFAGVVLALGLSCKVDTSGQCIVGPCGPPKNIELAITVVVGIPANVVVDGVAHLMPGDTLGLHVVRFTNGSACTARDTVRDSIRWGSTDSLVATVTAMPDGGGLLRARANGTFNVLMLQGQNSTISPALPPQYVQICPAAGVTKAFRVGP